MLLLLLLYDVLLLLYVVAVVLGNGADGQGDAYEAEAGEGRGGSHSGMVLRIQLDPYQHKKWDPDPYQIIPNPPHCFRPLFYVREHL